MSPTVNLYFSESDMQNMAADLRHYMNVELSFIPKESHSEKWPMAMLDDILIGFNHASLEEEAAEVWNKRRTRINYDNIWLLSSDKGLTYEQIQNFGKIPAKGRVMFTAEVI